MLTYTRPNAVELLFSLLTAGTVDRETSSARVEKTVVHYFRDACPVCVCLHGAEWAGRGAFLPARTPPCGKPRPPHGAQRGQSQHKTKLNPSFWPRSFQKYFLSLLFFFFFLQEPLLSRLDHGLVQWRAVTLITVLQSNPLPNVQEAQLLSRW